MTIEDLIKERVVERVSYGLISYIGKENIDDFIQDIYMEVMTMDPVRRDRLGNNLIRYVSKVCINQAVGKFSQFKKKYRKDQCLADYLIPIQTTD